MKEKKRILIYIVIQIIILNATNSLATLGPCNPEETGDWIVNTPMTCSNTEITLNGDLTINNALELINVNLSINSTDLDGHTIEATEGSTFRILNSHLNTTNMSNKYSMFIHATNFSIINSTMINFGSKDPELFSTYTSSSDLGRYNEYGRYFWLQGETTNRHEQYWFDDGFYLNTTAWEFDNNIFHNYTSIWVIAPNNTISNNNFTGFQHNALMLETTANHTNISNNYFGHGARMNKKATGIKIMRGIGDIWILDNHFEWVSQAIETPAIPAGNTEGLHFIGNKYNNIVQGIFVQGNHIESKNEHYEHMYAIGISIGAYYNVTLKNNTYLNLTFQEPLEHTIDDAYRVECTIRGVLPNQAFYWWVFYTTKAFVKTVFYGNLLVVEDNYFGYSPPYGTGIIFDGSTHHNFRVYDNKFERIGNYIPEGYIVREDNTGMTPLAGDANIPGAAIGLEGIKLAEIEGNQFIDVTNGILTTTPDALGSTGEYKIKHNYFSSRKSFTYTEKRYLSGWTLDTEKTDYSIGIGTGTNGYGNPPFGCDPTGNPFLYAVYAAEYNQTIENNTFVNFNEPIVVDYARDQSCEVTDLGPKHAQIFNNSFVNNTQFKLWEGPPSTITFADNKYFCDEQTENNTCSADQQYLCQNMQIIQCPIGQTCQLGTCTAGATCGPYDTTSDGIIETGEMNNALQDWANGTLDIDSTIKLIRSWINGTCNI